MRVMHWVAIVAMLLVSGCGFYLKGQRPLPQELKDVRISNSSSVAVESELERALRTEVERRGGRIAAVADASVLQISNINEDEQVLSLGPDGKAIEYLFSITVYFSLTRNGQPAVSEQSLTVYEEYSFDKREIVSSEHESQNIRDAMYRELAELIMLRLETSLRS